MTKSVVPTVMSARRTALVGGLLVAVGPLSISLYSPALPTVVQDLATSEAMGKLSISVYFAAFAFTQLICGPLSDSWGRRKVAVAFLAIYVLGSLTAAFAPSIGFLLAGRILQGIGVSVGVALSRAMVRDQFVGRDAIGILALVNLVLTVAPAVAPTLGSMILLFGDWHSLFLVMASYGAFLIVLIGAASRETHPEAKRTPFSPRAIVGNYWHLLTNARFLAPATILGLSFGGFYGFAALLPFILIGDLGLSPFQFAMALLVQTGSYLIGNLLASYAAKRFTGDATMRIGLILQLLGGVGFAIGLRVFPESVMVVMAPVSLWMLALALIGPSATAAAMDGFGSIAGAAGALTGFFQVGGGFAASLLASLLFADASGALASLIPAMAALAVVVALLHRIRTKARQDAIPET